MLKLNDMKEDNLVVVAVEMVTVMSSFWQMHLQLRTSYSRSSEAAQMSIAPRCSGPLPWDETCNTSKRAGPTEPLLVDAWQLCFITSVVMDAWGQHSGQQKLIVRESTSCHICLCAPEGLLGAAITASARPSLHCAEHRDPLR